MPRIFGGNNGDTEFNTFDISSTNTFYMGGQTSDSDSYPSLSTTQPVILSQSLSGVINWQQILTGFDLAQISHIRLSKAEDKLAVSAEQIRLIFFLIIEASSGSIMKSYSTSLTQDYEMKVTDMIHIESGNEQIYALVTNTDNSNPMQRLIALDSSLEKVVSERMWVSSDLNIKTMILDYTNNVMIIGGFKQEIISSYNQTLPALISFGISEILSNSALSFTPSWQAGFIEDMSQSDYMQIVQMYILEQTQELFACTIPYQNSDSNTRRSLMRIQYTTAIITERDYFSFSSETFGDCLSLFSNTASEVFMISQFTTIYPYYFNVIQFKLSSTGSTAQFQKQTTFKTQMMIIHRAKMHSLTQVYLVGAVMELYYMEVKQTLSSSSNIKSYLMSMQSEETCFPIYNTGPTAITSATLQPNHALTQPSQVLNCNMPLSRLRNLQERDQSFPTLKNQESFLGYPEERRNLLVQTDCKDFNQDQNFIPATPTLNIIGNSAWCKYLSTSSFQVSNTTYTISDPIKVVNFGQITNSCPNALLYQLFKIVNSDTNTLLAKPDFITVDSTNGKISITTNQSTDVGIYQLYLRGYASGAGTVGKSFFLTITGSVNTTTSTTEVKIIKPIIPYFNDNLSNQTVQVGLSMKFTLPSSTNENNNTNFIQVQFGTTSTFVKYSQNSKTFSINPSNNAQAGTHVITVVLIDSVMPTLRNYYQFFVTVLKAKPISLPQPAATVDDFLDNIIQQQQNQYPGNNQGQADVNVPLNTTEIQELVQFLGEDINIEDFEKIEEMLLNQNSSVFKLTLSKLIIKKSYSQNLSPKISRIDQTGRVYVDFGRDIVIPQSFKNFSSSVIQITLKDQSSSSLLSLRRNLGISTSELAKIKYLNWKIIKFTSRQMIIQIYFDDPSKISASSSVRDQIQIKFIMNGLFLDLKTKQPVKFLYSTEKSIPPQMRDDDATKFAQSIGPSASDGIKSMMIGNFVINIFFLNILITLGSMNFYLWFFAALTIITFLMKPFYKKFKLFDKVYLYFAGIVFFNGVLRFFIEGYLEFILMSIVSSLNVNLETYTEQLSTLMAFIILIICSLLPILAIILLKRFKRNLEDKSVESAIGCIYEGLKTASPFSLYYMIWFMMRRFSFAIVAIFLSETSSCFHIIFLLMQQILHLIYIISLRPFEESSFTNLEIFDEICILGIIYHFLVFQDFVDNEDIQYNAGWSVTMILAFLILVNLSIMMGQTYHTLKLTIKKTIQRFKLWRKKNSNYDQVAATDRSNKNQHALKQKLNLIKLQAIHEEMGEEDDVNFYSDEDNTFHKTRRAREKINYGPNAGFGDIDTVSPSKNGTMAIDDDHVSYDIGNGSHTKFNFINPYLGYHKQMVEGQRFKNSPHKIFQPIFNSPAKQPQNTVRVKPRLSLHLINKIENEEKTPEYIDRKRTDQLQSGSFSRISSMYRKRSDNGSSTTTSLSQNQNI